MRPYLFLEHFLIKGWVIRPGVGLGWNRVLYKQECFLIYSTLAISVPRRPASYLCKQTNARSERTACVQRLIFHNRFTPWCNGASGQPRTACVLSDYEQIHSTRLSLFSCMCQDWNGLEQTAHGAAMLQWFAFTCRDRHPWLAWTEECIQASQAVQKQW